MLSVKIGRNAGLNIFLCFVRQQRLIIPLHADAGFRAAIGAGRAPDADILGDVDVDRGPAGAWRGSLPHAETRSFKRLPTPIAPPAASAPTSRLSTPSERRTFSITPGLPPENWATVWATWTAWLALREPADLLNSRRARISSCARSGVEAKLTCGREAAPETRIFGVRSVLLVSATKSRSGSVVPLNVTLPRVKSSRRPSTSKRPRRISKAPTVTGAALVPLSVSLPPSSD